MGLIPFMNSIIAAGESAVFPNFGTFGIALGAALLVLVLLLAARVYNRFVSTRVRVGNAWAHVDADLKMRHDLIPNLVEVVKGYAAHESDLFESIARIRRDATDPRGALEGEAAATRGTKKLVALGEAYPDLKADPVFARLSKEITAIEEKIAFGRAFVNDVVNEHNTLIESFPNLLFAGLLGFRPLPLWRK